jgi:hypothetical protein
LGHVYHTTPRFLTDSLLSRANGLFNYRDVAERIPSADVKGIDLSPIQPIWVPPNAHFEVDDFNMPWESDEQYDLIHTRELLGSVPDWPRLLAKCFK